MTYPFTRFSMTLSASSDLLIGEFAIFYEEHRYDVFPCSSGLRGYQTAEHFWTRGKGPIPPTGLIRGEHRLATASYYSEKVGGLFFHIVPDPIICEEDGSLLRCEIGMHLDTHGPGTSGCEGIQGAPHFNHLAYHLYKFRDGGTLWLPHEVVYL